MIRKKGKSNLAIEVAKAIAAITIALIAIGAIAESPQSIDNQPYDQFGHGVFFFVGE